MDIANHHRAGYRQQVITALQFTLMLSKTGTSEVVFSQLILLNHRSHTAVEDKNPVWSVGKCVMNIRRAGFFCLAARFNSLDDFFYFEVGIILEVCGVQVASLLEVIYYLHGLFNLALIMEVHLQMHTIAADMVEQRT